MHDQVGVRVRHRRLHVEEQPDARLDARAAARRSRRSMCWPSTCSSTRYGWPVFETPASIRRAMCGCVSRARMVPSRRKRSSPPRPTSAALSSLTADLPLEAAVAARGQPHAAHAAVADRRRQRVGADRHAGQRGSGRSASRAAPFEEALGVSWRCSSSIASTSVAISGSSRGGRARQASRSCRREVEHAIEVPAGPQPASLRSIALMRRFDQKDRKRRVERRHQATGRRPAGRDAGRCAPSPSRAARSAPRRSTWPRSRRTRSRRRT